MSIVFGASQRVYQRAMWPNVADCLLSAVVAAIDIQTQYLSILANAAIEALVVMLWHLPLVGAAVAEPVVNLGVRRWLHEHPLPATALQCVLIAWGLAYCHDLDWPEQQRPQRSHRTAARGAGGRCVRIASRFRCRRQWARVGLYAALLCSVWYGYSNLRATQPTERVDPVHHTSARDAADRLWRLVLDYNKAQPVSVASLSAAADPARFLLNFVHRLSDTFRALLPGQLEPPDVMPAQRTKAIHGSGAIAQALLIWDDTIENNYTCLFRRGSRVPCLLRVSIPLLIPGHFAPALALKCFRDGGTAPAHIMAIRTPSQVQGIDVTAVVDTAARAALYNVFRDPLLSHAQRPLLASTNTLPEQLVASRSRAQVSSYVGMLGLSNFARSRPSPIDTDDTTRASSTRFPFVMAFRPHPAASRRYAQLLQTRLASVSAAVDVRDIDPSAILPTLFAPDDWLFEIYAARDPPLSLDAVPQLVRLGRLELQSEFVASSLPLYFEHQRFEDDLAIRPEWTALVTSAYQEACYDFWSKNWGSLI